MFKFIPSKYNCKTLYSSQTGQTHMHGLDNNGLRSPTPHTNLRNIKCHIVIELEDYNIRSITGHFNFSTEISNFVNCKKQTLELGHNFPKALQ